MFWNQAAPPHHYPFFSLSSFSMGILKYSSSVQNFRTACCTERPHEACDAVPGTRVHRVVRNTADAAGSSAVYVDVAWIPLEMLVDRVCVHEHLESKALGHDTSGHMRRILLCCCHVMFWNQAANVEDSSCPSTCFPRLHSRLVLRRRPLVRWLGSGVGLP